jgi:tRNA(His) 5'-end guanylyltransferase
MMEISLSDRMKDYEMAEAGRRCLPLLPVLIRLDGKNFSSFTKGLKRPYDERLSNLMVEVTKYLIEETNACCAYTGSDEITLALYSSDSSSQIYFDGRIQKLTSVVASKCSVRFNKLLPCFIPEKADQEPVFDCRTWNVPTLEEGANAFLFREQDTTRNSIGMAAETYYSHSQLMNKNSKEKQEMLWKGHNINWNDYPSFFKRGSYIQRRIVIKKFSSDELEKLPLKHEARTNPDLMIERTEYVVLDMPPLSKVKNRVGVIFRGESIDITV